MHYLFPEVFECERGAERLCRLSLVDLQAENREGKCLEPGRQHVVDLNQTGS